MKWHDTRRAVVDGGKIEVICFSQRHENTKDEVKIQTWRLCALVRKTKKMVEPLGILIYVVASIGVMLFFEAVFYVTHYILYGESVGECLKNDPLKRRLQKGLVDLVVGTIVFAVLLALFLSILFAFNI